MLIGKLYCGLQCARYWVKGFTYINSSNLHNSTGQGRGASQASQQGAGPSSPSFRSTTCLPACAQAPTYQLQQLCTRLVLPS